ncbi:MAG: YecA family protein [Acidimicrobiales bacterium]
MVAKVGRNELCSCGSSLKAKRCCLAEPELRTTTPRATLARLQTSVMPALRGIGRERFGELYDEVIYLPELDVSLHVPLPVVFTPDLESALYACSVHDGDAFDHALRAVLPSVDTIENRLRLAEAVLALRDLGRIPPRLAAVAVVDLNQAASAFLLSSLAQSVGVRSGDERTPSGLLVAAS